MFSSLLVANRGEIAVRVIRAARELRIETIAVHSAVEAHSPHALLADRAVCVGGAPAAESYLDIDAVVAAARDTGADAVHPGYGFLAENAEFARRCAAAGIVFVGPTPEVIAVMGDKTAARLAAQKAGVPLLPGSDGPVAPGDMATAAAEIGYPVVVKAAFGGGGRGLRVVGDPRQLDAAVGAATREATAAFGRPELFVERYLPDARHLEVQILGDTAGSVVALGDRDCTVQRRHQKLLEEAPAPGLPDRVRDGIRDASVELARSVGYVGAGTVEFLYSPGTAEFFFLEMNTRLQVEHGVTELVTGVDLVAQQLRIAAGEPLTIDQRAVTINGHAIQARISAEDPWSGFVPRTGTLRRVVVPQAPWVRVDFGVTDGNEVPPHYDSMIGKVLAWAPDRDLAATRLRLALSDLTIDGVPTTAPYLAGLLDRPDYRALDYSTDTVGTRWAPDRLGLPGPATPDALAPVSGPDSPPDAGFARHVTIQTDRGPLPLAIPGRPGTATRTAGRRRPRGENRPAHATAGTPGEPVAPMDATVVRVEVTAGQSVEAGQALVVLEAMKMEMPVTASRAGIVTEVLVSAGARVTTGQAVAVLG